MGVGKEGPPALFQNWCPVEAMGREDVRRLKDVNGWGCELPGFM